MKYKRYLFFVILATLSIAYKCNSQCLTLNLIKNPGLEEYNCCPYYSQLISCANYWTQPLAISTSEYLNTCAVDSLMGSGDGYYFYLLHAQFGNGYAGIATNVYNPNTLPPFQYREYFQGNLSSPLTAGQCYYCRFWVKLFNFHNEGQFCGIDALGIYFSDTLPTTDAQIETAMFFPAQINNQTGRVISDTSSWTMISDTFVAKGGEQYFTVGTFKQESEINKIYLGTPHANVSYYFFDNFSLCPCSDTMPPPEPQNTAYIPNVFSPNGDGANDFFLVKGQNIDQISLKIYNRWGNLVFEGQEASPAWDGRWQGKECPVGVYYYTAEITYQNGAVEQKHGNVTIVR